MIYDSCLRHSLINYILQQQDDTQVNPHLSNALTAVTGFCYKCMIADIRGVELIFQIVSAAFHPSLKCLHGGEIEWMQMVKAGNMVYLEPSELHYINIIGTDLEIVLAIH